MSIGNELPCCAVAAVKICGVDAGGNYFDRNLCDKHKVVVLAEIDARVPALDVAAIPQQIHLMCQWGRSSNGY